MNRAYVLDANALLAFVQDEPGSQRVERLLREARQQHRLILISVINFGEVCYLLWEKRGEQNAREIIARLRRLPLDFIPVNLEHALKACEIKATHNIPYVDSIAASLAVLQSATLVTSDRHFEKLGRHFPILWIAHS